MEITERDIFNLVFINHSVSPKKKKLISETKELSYGVKFYQTLKTTIDKNIPVEVKSRIKEKIPVYNSLIFIFNPVKDKVRNKKRLV